MPRPKTTAPRTIALARVEGDDRLVDQTITRLSRMLRQSLIDAVISVGDVLIEAFFDGDLDLARSHDPRKATALSRLYERAASELPISSHALKRAIRLAVQYRDLPPALRNNLNLKQQEALLPLPDVRAKRRLAESAVSKGLNGRQLGVAVRAELDRAPARRSSGRPVRPVLAKHLDAIERLVGRDAVGPALTSAALRSLDPAAARRMERQARRLRGHLARIADALARRTTARS